MDAQQRIAFDPRPNRPNNWFLCDVLRAMEQARLCETLMRVGPNVCWLVTVIVTREHTLRYQQTPHFTERQLVELTGIPKTTLRRAVDAAKARGWLIEVPTGNSGAWWRVVIPVGLESVAAPDVVRSTEPSGPDHAGTGPEVDQNRTRSGPEPDQKWTILDPSPNPLPPPSPSPVDREDRGGRADDENLTEALRRRGVRLASTTVHRALSQGRAPAEIRARIQHYDDHPGAWGPGALSYVLTCPDYAGGPVDDWPPPDAAWAKSQAETAASLRQRQADARREQEARANQTRVDREREELRQLELDFGAAVDQSDQNELLELLDAPHQFAFRAAARGGGDPLRSPLVRPALLRAFAARAAHN